MSRIDDRALLRLVHGEGSAEERRALERALAQDPALAARYGRLAETWDALGSPPERMANDSLVPSVMATIRRRQEGTLDWSGAPSWVRVAAALALASGLALGVGAGRVATPEPLSLDAWLGDSNQGVAERWWRDLESADLDVILDPADGAEGL